MCYGVDHISGMHITVDAVYMHFTEFWQYESSYREQPNVRYVRQLMVYLSDSHPGRDRAWGSFPNFIQLLDDNTISRPLIRVCSYRTIVNMLSLTMLGFIFILQER